MGILNGINTDAWNPASDNFLKVQYSANDMQGKAENKAAMRRDLVLSSADDQWPVVGCITRLVPQKGVHLIKHAIYRTLEMGNQFELLGSCPVPHIQNFTRRRHVKQLLSLRHHRYSPVCFKTILSWLQFNYSENTERSNSNRTK
ncbi:hypothetical protein V6Z11_D10G162100 [Gossypium hirsutum]